MQKFKEIETLLEVLQRGTKKELHKKSDSSNQDMVVEISIFDNEEITRIKNKLIEYINE